MWQKILNLFKPTTVKNTAKVVALVAAVVTGFTFSTRSNDNLIGVCPPLVQVAHCTIKITPVDFMIIDGLRTEEEHVANVAKGVSWVKRSLHQDGLAIDFVVWKNGQISWDPKDYHPVAAAFKDCGAKTGNPIVWGGDWRVKDYGHIELKNRVCFPVKEIGDV